MSVSIKDLPPRYQEQIANALAKEASRKVAVPVANVEPAVCHEPLAARQAPYFASPVDIHIHSRRKRLCDADGVSGKAVIDQLTRSGIIHDDDTAHVRQVTYSQEKGEPEETTITITEAT